MKFLYTNFTRYFIKFQVLSVCCFSNFLQENNDISTLYMGPKNCYQIRQK